MAIEDIPKETASQQVLGICCREYYGLLIGGIPREDVSNPIPTPINDAGWETLALLSQPHELQYCTSVYSTTELTPANIETHLRNVVGWLGDLTVEPQMVYIDPND